MSEPKRLSAERLAWLLPLPTELRNHIDAIEAELAAAKAEVERLLEEVEGVLSIMPPWSVIRSCEGGGHEDVAGSLALSVSCLVEHLRRRGA